MNRNWVAKRLGLLVLLSMVVWMTAQARGQDGIEGPATTLANAGSEITYQGYLQADGAPAQGRHDFVFRLWDAAARGRQVGQAVTVEDVNVIDGQFTALVDFGARVFNGQALYLEIDVKPSSEAVYETLSPRQLLSGVPLAHSVRPGMTVVNGDSGTSAALADGAAGVRGSGGDFGGSFSGNTGVLVEGVLDDLVLSGGGLLQGAGTLRSDPNVAGSFLVFTSSNGITLALNSSDGTGDGLVVIDGGETTLAVANSELTVHDDEGAVRATLAAVNQRGALYLRMPNALIGLSAQAHESSGGGGLLRLFNASGGPTLTLDGQQANGTGGSIVVQDGQGDVAARLYHDPFEGGGQIELAGGDGEVKLVLEGAESADDGSMIIMRAANDNDTVVIDADGYSLAGPVLSMRDIGSNPGVVLQVDELGYDGGQIRLFDGDGDNTITLDADYEGSGTGRVTAPVLEITGGADLAEGFDVAVASGTAAVTPAPGMVVCIDPDSPGRLVVCSQAYDRTVAGIISGAGDVSVGLLMGQQGSEADGAYPVALAGRVYVWAEAGAEAIMPGDLMTTSARAGFAMRAVDATQAYGAILGKAMSGLEAGESGLLLLLVSLQ